MFPFDEVTDTPAMDQLLDDLDLRRDTQVHALRDRAAARAQTRVTVRRGNMAERAAFALSFTTAELGPNSVVGIADAPLLPGDVFHLTFEGSAIENGPTFALCDRCTLLGDAAFELRLRPLQPLSLRTPGGSA